ncbi:methionyl-tRNA formyltransferase [Aetokthonos hydrillicola Thurmond2011]|jgi:methionyl-tRNA formyltransferase|uniref:Methionyl-tRNA formyltransferase n=1 Tax=Aetokthonos hydrillicola Thurmond2011 TaxID=2712845 RepID=A0AAP5IC73_9CYAN|nr:methionyl-tRNA formyltransferase [Aetokthonos hydrillicola]MBO3463334.1 methionyl-tRNA formyltransferase [Aetokthonos hydrillicola CCALA 1050]MBW4589181.1 methionyl-tRNA formyltransferase [Aetokthonos hydrillicola CCALA 1050]MDR9898741.1 methionyl-tRNA formyltransferase [Aetokthonos hydrillicola Thurmond2011]
MINVLLIGLGITTLTALESLISNCNIQGIVRNIDVESYTDDPIIILAKQSGIPIFTEVSQQQIKDLILQLKPDYVVVSSYNKILTPEIIELCTFINVHYSPLPQYRGRANVNWAMINDERFAAITIHRISPELDEGNILFQQLIPISSEATVADLYHNLNEIQREHLGKTLVKAFDGCEGIPQDSSKATYCCTRLPDDGEINWSESTRKIDCFIRALVFPFPGAYTYFQGKKLIIWQAKPVDDPPTYVGRVPGRIIARSKSKGYVDVLTGDGVLRIWEVQWDKGEKTAASNVIKSVKSTLGLSKSDLLNRLQVLEEEITNLKKYCTK